MWTAEMESGRRRERAQLRREAVRLWRKRARDAFRSMVQTMAAGWAETVRFELGWAESVFLKVDVSKQPGLS